LCSIQNEYKFLQTAFLLFIFIWLKPYSNCILYGPLAKASGNHNTALILNAPLSYVDHQVVQFHYDYLILMPFPAKNIVSV
jgi:hypothetical protein